MQFGFCFLGIIFFSTILRLIPHYLAPLGLGVDHWYWKAYIEAFRKTSKFPPEMPQFLLDEKQWYPPLFGLAVNKLPTVLFDKYGHYLAIAIDTIRLILLMLSAYLLTGRLNSMVAAGIAYSLTPILISYNIQLNPRGLGALFLDIIILLLIWLIWHNGMIWGWGIVALISGLMLLTHKMTTQLFWYMSIVSGIFFRDWRLIMLVPLSITSALILSRGFYISVLKAHWDIVTFWNSNWRWLASHPVLESPIYGKTNFQTPTKYFLPGLKGFIRRAQFLIGFNAWGWAIFVAALWIHGSDTRLTNEDIWLMDWLGVVLSFVALTTFIPFMRCLGNGYLYGYNAAFPAALLVAMIWGGLKHTNVVNIILALTLIASISGIVFYFWTVKHSKTLKVDEGMNNMLQHLNALSPGVVMCLPQHWHDLVAYKTNKDVLFGGHGYGFKLLTPIFPRFLKKISYVIAENNVSYLLTYEEYLPKNFLEDLPPASIDSFGAYRLYVFHKATKS